MSIGKGGVGQDIVQRDARPIDTGPRIGTVSKVGPQSQAGDALLLGESTPRRRLRVIRSYCDLMYDLTAIGVDQTDCIITPCHCKQLPYSLLSASNTRAVASTLNNVYHWISNAASAL